MFEGRIIAFYTFIYIYIYIYNTHTHTHTHIYIYTHIIIYILYTSSGVVQHVCNCIGGRGRPTERQVGFLGGAQRGWWRIGVRHLRKSVLSMRKKRDQDVHQWILYYILYNINQYYTCRFDDVDFNESRMVYHDFYHIYLIDHKRLPPLCRRPPGSSIPTSEGPTDPFSKHG